MNWFALLAGILYVGAAISSVRGGHFAFAGMWFFYAMANMCIVIAEYKN